VLVSKSILRAGWSPWGVWGHIFDLSNRNKALSPSIWADSRDVAKPDIIGASLSQTCHSHRRGIRAVTFTSSKRNPGILAIPWICAATGPFSSPAGCLIQTDHYQTPIAGIAGLTDAGPACGLHRSGGAGHRMARHHGPGRKRKKATRALLRAASYAIAGYPVPSLW
jgi:hypothetical protein